MKLQPLGPNTCITMLFSRLWARVEQKGIHQEAPFLWCFPPFSHLHSVPTRHWENSGEENSCATYIVVDKINK
jgi:hypothetical protein